MLKRVNTRAAEELERLNSICDRPHASSTARVTQAPTCEEENGESTGERGGGNSRRMASHYVKRWQYCWRNSDGGAACQQSGTVSTARINPSTIQTLGPLVKFSGEVGNTGSSRPLTSSLPQCYSSNKRCWWHSGG